MARIDSHIQILEPLLLRQEKKYLVIDVHFSDQIFVLRVTADDGSKSRIHGSR